jgi:hypothetical protein
MTIFGIILIAVGFIIGALTAVVEKEVVRWIPYAVALAVGIVGIIIVKMSLKKEARSKEVLTKNMESIEQSINNIIKNLKGLNERKNEIHTYDMRHKIDELFLEDLNNFVEARESISHTYSVQAYADVMSHFAAGDRYLNRVWCASADGYIDEVNEYLEKSLEQFEDSKKKLEECKA